MKSNPNLLNCAGERSLGSTLAATAGAKKTQSTFLNSNSNPEKILNVAVAELQKKGGMDSLVEGVLQGPTLWAYYTLRYVQDIGEKREELLNKVAEDAKSAFLTLRYVPNLGDHRDILMKKVASDTGFSQLAKRYLMIPQAHQGIVLAAANDAPPTQIGGGYNTYFVNQTGGDIYVMYNTGMSGSDGSITGPTHVLRGQNIGYGRGGTCISELRVWSSKPQKWSENGGSSWQHQNIDGCLSWGFRFTAGLNIAEAYAWAEGQGGMPSQYPPSNGN